MKSHWSALVLVGILATFVLPSSLWAQEEIEGEKQEAPVVEEKTEKESSDDFLSRERQVREKCPEVFSELTIVKRFAKRLPKYWRSLALTKRQTNEIYAVQEAYFTEITALLARVERLEAERDSKLREILTSEQQEALKEKLKEAEDARKERQAKKKDASETANP